MTETDSTSLRKVRDEVPARVWLVSTVIFFERAAYYGAVTLFRKCVSSSVQPWLISQKKTIYNIQRIPLFSRAVLAWAKIRLPSSVTRLRL